MEPPEDNTLNPQSDIPMGCMQWHTASDDSLPAGSSDRTIKLWDVGTGTELHTPTSAITDGAWSLAFSPTANTASGKAMT